MKISFNFVAIYFSQLFIDALLLTSIIGSILSVQLNSTILLLLTSLSLTWTVISAHNYFHTRDNFRMTYFNFTFLSYKEWRISHALSHHLYPNSLFDLEITLFEPFLCWVPKAKNFIQRYASWIYGPIIYGFVFFDQFVIR